MTRSRPTSFRGIGILPMRLGISLAFSALFLGCAPKPIFPPVNPPLVWPSPPEPPRISYVGRLITSADLKPATSPLDSIGGAIFGKKPIHSMLTPFATCTDQKNRLFVADTNAQVVHVFDLSTRKYERWQPAPKRPFAQPVGI